MISRVVVRPKPFVGRLLMHTTRTQRVKPSSWMIRAKDYIDREMSTMQDVMVTRSSFHFKNPITRKQTVYPTCLSDIAGHTSFMLLAISYLETDFLQLRLFAFSGVTLSIIFQYYREKPLWIPIRWNSLFLLINAIMIVYLLKEENDASNIPEEKKEMFARFERKGMKPVEFLQLASGAKRLELKKGDELVSEHAKNTRVYFVKSGQLSVLKNGSIFRTIQQNQFAGEMSFLQWEDKLDATQYLKKKQKKTLKQWKNKDNDMELFVPLLIIFENFFDQVGIRKMYRKPNKETPLGLLGTSENTSTTTATTTTTVDHSHSTSDTVSNESIEETQSSSSSSAWSLFWGSHGTSPYDPSSGSDSDMAEHHHSVYGISFDHNGNVIDHNQSNDQQDAQDPHDSPQPQTVFGRYLNATYSFVGALVSSSNDQSADSSNDHGEFAAATVVADEDCVLYYWSFKRLRSLMQEFPSMGLSFERALSEDLNNKMNKTMQVQPVQRYQLMLTAALMDGEPTEASMATLSDFRQAHSISLKDHSDVLARFGWTPEDFEAGFKGAPSPAVMRQYQSLLSKALANTDEEVLSDHLRTELRVYRVKHGVNSAAHLCVLNKLGWTVDEYEIGSRNPAYASQKENRAAAANERRQRRNDIRTTVLSFIFPSSWMSQAQVSPGMAAALAADETES